MLQWNEHCSVWENIITSHNHRHAVIWQLYNIQKTFLKDYFFPKSLKQMKNYLSIIILTLNEFQTFANQNYNEISLHICQNIVKKTRNNKCWRGYAERGSLVHCWWECKLVQPLWRTVGRFLKKLKIELSYDPAIPPLGIYPKRTKTTN